MSVLTGIEEGQHPPKHQHGSYIARRNDRRVFAFYFDQRHGRGSYERTISMIKHRATYKDIGLSLGVTLERARQITKKHFKQQVDERRMQEMDDRGNAIAHRYTLAMHEMFCDTLFQKFCDILLQYEEEAGKESEIEFIPWKTDIGYRKSEIVVNKKHIIMRNHASYMHQGYVTYRIHTPRIRFDYLFALLDYNDYIFMPADVMPRREIMYIPEFNSKYNTFRNSFDVLNGSGQI